MILGLKITFLLILSLLDVNLHICVMKKTHHLEESTSQWNLDEMTLMNWHLVEVESAIATFQNIIGKRKRTIYAIDCIKIQDPACKAGGGPISLNK